MIEELKSVGFVCFANYCRSPVAEVLFKEKFGDLVKTDSSGLDPMVAAAMDPRSIDYLKLINISFKIHSPKKINKKFLDSSQIIFAMDTYVLMQLNRIYKNYRNKFKLFTYQHRNIQISDPYKLSEQRYKNVMDEIKFVIDSFELEELL